MSEIFQHYHDTVAWHNVFANAAIFIAVRPCDMHRDAFTVLFAHDHFLFNFQIHPMAVMRGAVPLHSLYGNCTDARVVLQLEMALTQGKPFDGFINLHRSDGFPLSCHVQIRCEGLGYRPGAKEWVATMTVSSASQYANSQLAANPLLEAHHLNQLALASKSPSDLFHLPDCETQKKRSATARKPTRKRRGGETLSDGSETDASTKKRATKDSKNGSGASSATKVIASNGDILVNDKEFEDVCTLFRDFTDSPWPSLPDCGKFPSLLPSNELDELVYSLV